MYIIDGKQKYVCPECGLVKMSKAKYPRCYDCKLIFLKKKSESYIRKDYELSKKKYTCPVCNERKGVKPYKEMCMSCQSKNAKVTYGKICSRCNERKIGSPYSNICSYCKSVEIRGGRSPICKCGKKIKGNRNSKTCWDCHIERIKRKQRYCFFCKNPVPYNAKNIKRDDKDVKCVKCYKGSVHKSYNHFKTDEERELGRCYAATKIWRKGVYARDFYTCQNCGRKKGVKINAHHIENYADNPSIRFNVDNGITLCVDCHRRFHSEYTNRHNNIFQLLNFLTP